MEKTETIQDYLLRSTQDALAEKMGVTQGAVSHMLRDNRNIFIRTINGHYVGHYEVKSKPRKKNLKR